MHDTSKLEIVACQMSVMMAKMAFDIVIQRGKACNNVAYAKARLNIQLHEARRQSLASLALIRKLKHRIESTNGESGKPLTSHDWAQSIAFKLDTLGWIYFRQGNLKYAQRSLQRACDLVPTDADIHYHLSRVYTERLQLTWKTMSSAKESPEMPSDLLLGIRHLREARHYDTENRLFGDLMRLSKRLENYEQDWRMQLFRGKGAEDDAAARKIRVESDDYLRSQVSLGKQPQKVE
jgi:tetratricopeptide (TPR) repeat protein